VNSNLRLEIDIDDLSVGWVKSGEVSIETGKILVVDPCFLRGEDEIENKVVDLFVEFHDVLTRNGLISDEMNINDIKRVASENDQLRVRFGEILFNGGAAVLSSTGFGDGKYPVFARVEYDPVWKTSRVVGIWIDFMCGDHVADED